MKKILSCSHGELERDFVSIYDEIKDVDRSQVEKADSDVQVMIKAVLSFKVFGEQDVERAVKVFKKSFYWGKTEELKEFLEGLLPETTQIYVMSRAPTLYLDSINTFGEPEKQFLLGYLGIGIADVAGAQYYIVDIDAFNSRLEEIDEEKEYLFRTDVRFSNEYIVKAKTSGEAIEKMSRYFGSRACKRVEVDREVYPLIVLKSECTNGKVIYTSGNRAPRAKLVRRIARK